MSECSAVRESMPLLLTESLDPARRELTHQHIESCAALRRRVDRVPRDVAVMADLPEVEVPARVKAASSTRAGLAARSRRAKRRPFSRRPAFKWVAQAAAVVVLARRRLLRSGTAPSRPDHPVHGHDRQRDARAMPIPELDTSSTSWASAGFKQDDVFLHQCPACKQNAVAIFAILARAAAATSSCASSAATRSRGAACRAWRRARKTRASTSSVPALTPR